ncbi:hypothetical protein SFV1gp32 [Sulfolobus filamentous virus 1]|uniref:Uncharacterized protein n=2 Tax=Alphalipothrixvirus beppuense TaxID=2734584 RepID=A0A346LU71_SUFV1|nr:hypothetical protein HOT91_gp32 [Sulfolobus filamentous virus 1]AXQ00114.1 hypothetical protein SFV1gp32 [Sulfolobus filamentous virus 1]AZI75734.1 hypothetical protein SBFV1_gp33 [Sulfolobales Beppu filamentous phage 1]
MSAKDTSVSLDIVIVIGLVAIAISIIFTFTVNPQLSSNTNLIQIVYVIVTGIISILSYITGKNTRKQ